MEGVGVYFEVSRGPSPQFCMICDEERRIWSLRDGRRGRDAVWEASMNLTVNRSLFQPSHLVVARLCEHLSRGQLLKRNLGIQSSKKNSSFFFEEELYRVETSPSFILILKAEQDRQDGQPRLHNNQDSRSLSASDGRKEVRTVPSSLPAGME